jgi:hypothetical protein
VRNEPNEQRVYFALSGREVKIGLAKNPPQRVAEMRVARPDIRLLGDIPGDRETERGLHQCFSEDQIAGEWFWFTTKVKAAIKDLLRRDNGTTVPLRIEKTERQNALVPEWLRVRDAVTYCRLSSTELFRLCTSGEIESIHKLRPGQAKGIRIIKKSSLDDYMRSFMPGGSRYVPDAEIRQRRGKAE